MKIVLSKLPESGWWKSGIPQYKDNPAMKKGQIPINSLLIKERDALIKAIQKEGHEIIELDFPKQLDSKNLIMILYLLEIHLFLTKTGKQLSLELENQQEELKIKLQKNY